MTPENKSKYNFVYSNANLKLTDVRLRKRRRFNEEHVEAGADDLVEIADDLDD